MGMRWPLWAWWGGFVHHVDEVQAVAGLVGYSAMNRLRAYMSEPTMACNCCGMWGISRSEWTALRWQTGRAAGARPAQPSAAARRRSNSLEVTSGSGNGERVVHGGRYPHIVAHAEGLNRQTGRWRCCKTEQRCAEAPVSTTFRRPAAHHQDGGSCSWAALRQGARRATRDPCPAQAAQAWQSTHCAAKAPAPRTWDGARHLPRFHQLSPDWPPP